MIRTDFINFEETCKNVKLVPSDLLEDGRLRLLVWYKYKENPKVKAKKMVIASAIANQDTGHIDEIHFASKTCDSKNKKFKVFAICIDNDWLVDNETVQYISIRNRVKKDGRFVNEHILNRIN